MRFPIGGERAMCHGPKLTNSLGKQRTWLARSATNQVFDTAILNAWPVEDRIGAEARVGVGD